MLYFENNPARNIFLCMKSCYICLQKQLEHCFIYFLWNIGCCVFKMSYPSWSACVGKLVNTESYIKSIALFLHKSRFFLFYYIEWKKIIRIIRIMNYFQKDKVEINIHFAWNPRVFLICHIKKSLLRIFHVFYWW